LRYILNAARPLLPDYPETQTAHLKSYLTLLGDIQNSSVLFRALEGFFDTAVPAELAHFYRKQQQELIADFIVQKNKVFEFWRKNPEDVLPWELKI
jgi:hypothetical protein